MERLLAQQEINIPGNIEGFGPLGLEGRNPSAAGGIFNNFISSAIGLLTVVAGLWFLFLIIIGAYGWMSAGGDKAKIEEAKKKLVNGLVGLIIVVVAVFLLDLVGSLLGLPYILDPGRFIFDVSP